jgi:hypothetical protein
MYVEFIVFLVLKLVLFCPGILEIWVDEQVRFKNKGMLLCPTVVCMRIIVDIWVDTSLILINIIDVPCFQTVFSFSAWFLLAILMIVLYHACCASNTHACLEEFLWWFLVGTELIVALKLLHYFSYNRLYHSAHYST